MVFLFYLFQRKFNQHVHKMNKLNAEEFRRCKQIKIWKSGSKIAKKPYPPLLISQKWAGDISKKRVYSRVRMTSYVHTCLVLRVFIQRIQRECNPVRTCLRHLIDSARKTLRYFVVMCTYDVTSDGHKPVPDLIATLGYFWIELWRAAENWK